MASDPGNGSSIDASILSAEIPLLRNLSSVNPAGQSAWATAYRIDVTYEDGKDQESYFMKVSVGEHGKRALHGEYESTLAIYNATPDFVPKPLSWGSFKALKDTHYYLCKFHELSPRLPPRAKFTEKLAKLHTEAKSPNGKFGFHVTTYNGNLPQDNTWADTWLECFINGFEHVIKISIERGGPWEEIEKLKPDMITKVIPRLLKPMETNQHSVEPVLVHGDLWCGNAAIDLNMRQPLVYDPSSFYAHNEYELGNWRPERNRFSRSYFKEYHQKIEKSYPDDDYDDRNALYAIRFNLNAAAIFPTDRVFRKEVEDEMKRLIAKFPGGFEDYTVPTMEENLNEGNFIEKDVTEEGLKESPKEPSFITKVIATLVSEKDMPEHRSDNLENNVTKSSAGISNADQMNTLSIATDDGEPGRNIDAAAK